MTGYVRVRTNIQISKTSAGKSLSKVYPHYQQRCRQNTAWAINPVPYRADNLGHKIRVDQNEKLEMHLVTRVAANDGHCYFVVGYATMPMKNNSFWRCMQVRMISVYLFIAVNFFIVYVFGGLFFSNGVKHSEWKWQWKALKIKPCETSTNHFGKSIQNHNQCHCLVQKVNVHVNVILLIKIY